MMTERVELSRLLTEIDSQIDDLPHEAQVAVSYTHLDVYKRQGRYNRFQFMLYTFLRQLLIS